MRRGRCRRAQDGDAGRHDHRDREERGPPARVAICRRVPLLVDERNHRNQGQTRRGSVPVPAGHDMSRRTPTASSDQESDNEQEHDEVPGIRPLRPASGTSEVVAWKAKKRAEIGRARQRPTSSRIPPAARVETRSPPSRPRALRDPTIEISVATLGLFALRHARSHGHDQPRRPNRLVPVVRRKRPSAPSTLRRNHPPLPRRLAHRSHDRHRKNRVTHQGPSGVSAKQEGPPLACS